MDAPALQLVRFDDCGADAKPMRGVAWVLEWAAALAVLCWASAILLAFAYQLSAERALSRAAAAGIREAACERATSRSVDAAVRRQLADHLDMNAMTKITLLHNGSLVGGAIRPRTGDRISITLTAPAAAALPHWLGRVLPWQQDAAITLHADGTSSRPVWPPRL